jgi:hypothetical protein
VHYGSLHWDTLASTGSIHLPHDLSVDGSLLAEHTPEIRLTASSHRQHKRRLDPVGLCSHIQRLNPEGQNSSQTAHSQVTPAQQGRLASLHSRQLVRRLTPHRQSSYRYGSLAGRNTPAVRLTAHVRQLANNGSLLDHKTRNQRLTPGCHISCIAAHSAALQASLWTARTALNAHSGLTARFAGPLTSLETTHAVGTQYLRRRITLLRRSLNSARLDL